MNGAELKRLLAPAISARGGNCDLLFVDYEADTLSYGQTVLAVASEMRGKKWDDLKPMLRERLDLVLPMVTG